jgi:hypothetical protein
VRLPSTVPGVRPRERRCAYCEDRIPPELGPAARYCSRAHRQRAYEARQADVTVELRRRIRALERKLAAFERVIDTAADRSPQAAEALADALQDETLAAYARGRAAAAARGKGPQNPRTQPTTSRTTNKINKNKN